MAQTQVSGLFQYLLFGTAAATTSTGVVDGGDLRMDPQVRRRLGLGGQDSKRGGVVAPGGAAQFYITNTNVTLAQALLRASYPAGALTTLEIEGGTDEWGYDYSTCVLVQGKLECPAGDAFKASVEWGCLTPAAAAGGTAVVEGAVGMDDYDFVASFEGDEYGVKGFSIPLNNNVSFMRSMDTAVAGAIRHPDHYIYGVEELTVELTAGRPLDNTTLNLWGDVLPNDLGIVLTGTGPSHIATLTLTNLTPTAPGFNFVDNNNQSLWTYRFMGNANLGSLDFDWAAVV